LNKAITILVAALIPEITAADTGEGLLEIMALIFLRYLNMLWPFLLPLVLLRGARKKFSFYVSSTITSGVLVWLLTFVVPQEFDRWLVPNPTVETLRLGLLYSIVASTLSIYLSLRISRRIRDFNDSHDWPTRRQTMRCTCGLEGPVQPATGSAMGFCKVPSIHHRWTDDWNASFQSRLLQGPFGDLFCWKTPFSKDRRFHLRFERDFVC